MTTYSPAQKVAFTTASAAALATAAAATYYVYRARRRQAQHRCQQSPIALRADPIPLPSSKLQCSAQPSSPDPSQLPVCEDQQPQPSETSSRSSSQPSGSSAKARVPTVLSVEVPVEAQMPAVTGTEASARAHVSAASSGVAAATDSFAWAVFWDIENVPVPKSTSATHFVQALRKTLAAHRGQTHPDSILRIHAIANVRRTSVNLRHHLQANGVNLTHVEAKGRKDAADKALITEICLITREHPTPFGVCLISGDGDFSYPVSRLAALGYATVVVAPTRQSFSTLLAAVPDTVIPLHAVLEGSGKPSREPQVRCMTKQQTMPHPLHFSTQVDKRVTTKRQRERRTSSADIAGRAENDIHPWSSDDDLSTICLSDCYSSPRSPEAQALQLDKKQHSHVLTNKFNRPYIASAGDSPVSPPQLMPLLHQQIQVPASARGRVDLQVPDSIYQNYRQRFNGSAHRRTNVSVNRTMPARKGAVDIVRGSRSKLNDRKGIANGAGVRFSTDNTASENGERTEPLAESDVRNDNGASRSNSHVRRPWRGGNGSSEMFIRSERWLYCGTRALPFVVFLLVLGISLLFASLRVATTILEGLEKV